MTLEAFSKKNIQYIVITFVFFLAAVVLVFAQSAEAQNRPQNIGNGLRISPVVSDDHLVEPGGTATITISVTNITENSIKAIVPEVNDFVASDNESGSPRILEEGEEVEFGLSQYMQPVDSFTLAGGETREVNVVFNFPLNTTPGTHTGVVRFSTDHGERETGVSLNASVGTLAFITINGELVENLSIADFSPASGEGQAAEAQSFFQDGPSGFITRVQNNGNVFSQPFGTINVKDMFGNTVESIQFNAPPKTEDGQAPTERGRVLPDSVRKFFTAADSSKYNVGRYTAEITVAYGDGGEFKTTVTNFWVIPWQLALAVVGGLILLILILTKGRRWYNERVLNKATRR